MGRPKSTHCKNGHLYTEESVCYMGGSRCCKQCRRSYEQERRRMLRESNPPKGRIYVRKERPIKIPTRNTNYDLSAKEIGRFLSKIRPVSDGSCWEWNGNINSYGYGMFTVLREKIRKTLQAHRVSYEHYKEKIAPGLVIDHLCRNRRCVNPDHLEPVTNRENLRRGESWNHPMPQPQSAKTHCPQGHPYDEKNTGYGIDSKGSKHRRCRACLRDYARRYRARNKPDQVPILPDH